MARPTRKTVDYFPHYCKHKQTMFIIDQNYQNNGYAFWFKLLELIGDTPGHYIDCKSLPAWQYLLSYTHFTHNNAVEICNLLSELNAIDKELWGKANIIWSQNFIDNISDLYKRRAVELPKRPSLNGREPSTKLLQQKNDNNPTQPIQSADNNSTQPIQSADNNPTQPIQSADNNHQIKVNQSKSNQITLSKDNDDKSSQHKKFKDYLNELKESKNKIAVLVSALKEWHDLPKEEFETNLHPRMGILLNQASKDSGYLLQIIWETSTKTINGFHLDYLTSIIRDKKRKDKNKSIEASIVQKPKYSKSPSEKIKDYENGS